MQPASLIAQKLSLPVSKVETVLSFLQEGATIPFIARYRKDMTGNLDEVQIQNIQEEQKALQAFAERKATIEKAITEQGKMTEALQAALDKVTTLAALEDLYLPYKAKRKTKAVVAREQGLEPLALLLLEQDPHTQPETAAAAYVNEAVPDIAAALQGARDILAEMANEDAGLRAALRQLFDRHASLQSKVLADKTTEAAKYKDYFDFEEPIHKIPSHRILAILRGFMEGFLRMAIAPPEDMALDLMEKQFLRQPSAAAEQVKKALKEAYRRLLQPSLESECRSVLKQKADEEAIQVFAENLRQLLLGAPLGSKRVLALDPGYRTGCKLVCLDEKGELLHHDLIYVHEAQRLASSEALVRHLVERFRIEAFAIGDGTAGRETEQFIKKLQLGLPVFLVNEDGASVYSASPIAREEFPDQDITVRGSVSIGRRLMDPLAELVKIDPKSIGVGQYQHDVNPYRLKEKLDQTVASCVNAVGVNLNTASKQLLQYVSGINESVAENIVVHRKKIGAFRSRQELMEVPRLGAKAFEQCAGFLRIPGGAHPLDASAVHPEAYGVVEAMAAAAGLPLPDLIGQAAAIDRINPTPFVSDKIGLLALKDILQELKKPGLDPRDPLEQFEFAAVYSMEDVQVGAILPGAVTNLTRFGAFIDIGVKQDGLVHISEMAHRYISDPAEVLKLGQKVQVKVLEVDRQRQRIALSIKQAMPAPTGKGNGNVRPPAPKKNNAAAPQDLSNLPVGDALALLKQKFGK